MLHDALQQRGLHTWMDIKGGVYANVNDSMAEGVEGAAVVVPIMSTKYQHSKNCKKELNYADDSGKPIVPVMAQPGFRATGWLGALTAGLLWHPLDDSPDSVVACAASIERELHKRGLLLCAREARGAAPRAEPAAAATLLSVFTEHAFDRGFKAAWTARRVDKLKQHGITSPALLKVALTGPGVNTRVNPGGARHDNYTLTFIKTLRKQLELALPCWRRVEAAPCRMLVPYQTAQRGERRRA